MKDARRAAADIIRKEPDVEFAYLFGSRATGRADDGSDWDIAVRYREKAEVSRWKRFYLEAEVSRMLSGEVQITVLNDSCPPLLLYEIVSKGIVLVDRSAGRRVVFEARALAAYHDWQYFQNRTIVPERGSARARS